MKKVLLHLAICVSLTITGFAQSPENFTYQTVVRDAGSNPISNQLVSFRMTILQGSTPGTIVYQETFIANTNSQGLVSLQLGSGTVVSGVFEDIAWDAGIFFLETAIDPTGGTSYTVAGTSQFVSVPYSLHSKTAAFASSADYNSLINKPITFTPAQAAKIDSITITNSVNLDQMSEDIAVNNTKASFPGFGTLPGTVLEGNNSIWSRVDSNIYYNSGSVGIGVDSTSSFGGSKLHVGGAILFDGIPDSISPGLLYYDTVGTGSFHFIDDTLADITLGNGTITYSGGMWSMVAGDATIANDVIIQGSMSLGFDAVIGENFGFNTLILKENNLRILFDDTDDAASYNPSNDWQIEINESRNGGTSHFGIIDITAGTTPFKIMAGAPDNSIFVNEDGMVGIGLSNPTSALEVAGTLKASALIGDGSGLTGITSGTGGISNPDNIIISADTNADNVGEIALQTQNITRMTITNDGRVGIGTASPTHELEVNGSAGFNNVTVSGNAALSSIAYGATNYTDAASNILDYNVSNKSLILFNSPSVQTIDGFISGVAGQEITISTLNESVIINHNGGGTQKILFPGVSNVTLNSYSSARFICDGTNWYCVGLNN